VNPDVRCRRAMMTSEAGSHALRHSMTRAPSASSDSSDGGQSAVMYEQGDDLPL